MIPLLNHLGAAAARAGFLMFLQISVMVALLWAFDRGTRGRVRSALRYALWCLVLVRLLLPPSLMLPTGVGFWLGRWFIPPIPARALPYDVRIVDPSQLAVAATASPTVSADPGFPEAEGRLSAMGVLLLVWLAGGLGLTAWIASRHRVIRDLRASAVPASERLLGILRASADELGLRRLPGLCLTRGNHSPAVCGLWRPVVMLPASMAAELGPRVLRDVLMHELSHVQRRDLWLNFLQAVVQVVWWWNPVVWFANARIRALREQAVDDRVMLMGASEGDGEASYPATLVAVARHFISRPAMSLAFLGILESPAALKHRVRRLLDEPLPQRANLGIAGWCAVIAVGFLALPMAYARRVEVASPPPAAKRGTVPPAAGAPETADPKALVTRQFRVEPNSFGAGLESIVGFPVGGSHPSAPTNGPAWHTLIGNFFTACGIPFPSVTTELDADSGEPRRAFFFNERAGILFVRTTRTEMETIEQALQAITGTPPQVMIEARFLEVDESVLKAIGLDRIVGNDPSTSAPNPAPSQTTAPSLYGILPPDQYRKVLEILRKNPSARTIATPKVITLSGRQAQIQAVQLMPIFEAASGITNQVPFGPTLDVLPEVGAEAGGIRITVLASLTKFLGYSPAPEKLPRISSSTLNTQAVVQDGQTLVLVAMPTGTESPANEPRKQLLLFVTPMVVDPAAQPANGVRKR